MSTSSSVGFDGVSKKNIFVFGPDGRLPGVEVAAVDERAVDAEARAQRLDDVAARAEQRAGRDDVIAGLHVRQDRGGDGGHAGRRGAAFLGAFEQPHALLEHGDGRIAEAANTGSRDLRS